MSNQQAAEACENMFGALIYKQDFSGGFVI